jgi:2-oxoglutarate ferredoxin oxidoreductase subunit alpha
MKLLQQRMNQAMTTIRPAVQTGEHFFNGDVACAEGAIASGRRFFAGYPITPAAEIAEVMSARMPERKD